MSIAKMRLRFPKGLKHNFIQNIEREREKNINETILLQDFNIETILLGFFLFVSAFLN